MRLIEWEPTIQKITDEYDHQPTEACKHKVLVEWRNKLEKAPTLLEAFQIDEIVREVRRRLNDKSRRKPTP